uniref:Inositol-tetrakisphosphate 1-kinase n=1 Tax=Sus scrofa TaxID=9823 RepID=A0A8D1PIK2_PIG
MCVFCVLRSLGLGDRGLNTGPVLEEFRDLSGFIQSVLCCPRGVSPPAAPSLCRRDVQRVWVAGARAQVLKLFFLCVSCSQLNLSRPIEEQGPLDVIIHKLTDVILEADQNDSQSLELVHRFQEYIDAHPETIVLDPLPAIRTLLDRSKSYELIRKIEAYMQDDRICSPPFMELTSLCGDDTMQLLEKNGLAFPFSAYCPGRGPAGGRPWPGRPGPGPLGGEGSGAPPPGRAAAVQPTRGQVLAPAPTCPFPRGAAGVFELPAVPGWALWGRTSLTALFFSPPPPTVCKTRVAHGTNSHEMAIVFNQEGLSAIQPPCVVQNFINHNAVLYKVFVVGESYTVVQRPSLKNFSAGTSDRESIFFNSHNVSKPESSSVLTALDKIEGVFERPSDEVIRALSRALRQALGVSLFGIDIIINNQTGQHAVIDINAFPGEPWGRAGATFAGLYAGGRGRGPGGQARRAGRLLPHHLGPRGPSGPGLGCFTRRYVLRPWLETPRAGQGRKRDPWHLPHPRPRAA